MINSGGTWIDPGDVGIIGGPDVVTEWDTNPLSMTFYLEAALVADPDNIAMLNLLAGAYLQSGRADQAFEVLQKAKLLDDRKSSTLINLASWYLNAGRLPEALENADAALERANWILTAHYIRVATLIEMNRIPEARDALVQALRLAPADPMLRRYAKTVSKRLGQP